MAGTFSFFPDTGPGKTVYGSLFLMPETLELCVQREDGLTGMSGTRAEGKDVMPGLSGRLNSRRGEFWVFTVTEGNLEKEQPEGSSSETLFVPADPQDETLT